MNAESSGYKALRAYYRRQWRIAELETQMQIAAAATPRWHKLFVRLELWLRRYAQR